MFAVDSSFDTAQGNKASHFAREATLMAGFDDLVDVFVGLRLFLGDTPPAPRRSATPVGVPSDASTPI